MSIKLCSIGPKISVVLLHSDVPGADVGEGGGRQHRGSPRRLPLLRGVGAPARAATGAESVLPGASQQGRAEAEDRDGSKMIYNVFSSTLCIY